MIYVKLPSNGREIGLRFEHHFIRQHRDKWAKPINEKYKGPWDKAADKRSTICQIRDASNNPATPITTAEVTWNPIDHFTKLGGQKRALTMALNYLTGLGVCTASDRAAVWHKFWEARRPTKGVGNPAGEIVAPEASGGLQQPIVDILETGEPIQGASNGCG